MEKPDKIECSEIYLRIVRDSDARFLTKWKNDPYLKRNSIGIDTLITEKQQFSDIVSSLESDCDWYYLIVKKAEDKPIGYIRINIIDDHGKFAWLRFGMGEERGKGYCKAGLQCFIGKLFELGFHRIECEVYDFNERSWNMLEKIGFRQEGLKRESHFDADEYTNVRCYGLLKNDFIPAVLSDK